MNLAAKEFIAARDDAQDVLSRFTSVSPVPTGALA
jgi:trehalose-6-phosphate synthase